MNLEGQRTVWPAASTQQLEVPTGGGSACHVPLFTQSLDYEDELSGQVWQASYLRILS